MGFLHGVSDPEILVNMGLGMRIGRTLWLLRGEDSRSKSAFTANYWRSGDYLRLFCVPAGAKITSGSDCTSFSVCTTECDLLGCKVPEDVDVTRRI